MGLVLKGPAQLLDGNIAFKVLVICRAAEQRDKQSQNAQRKMYTQKGNKLMFYCFIMVFYTLKKIIPNPKLNLEQNNVKAQENICIEQGKTYYTSCC